MFQIHPDVFQNRDPGSVFIFNRNPLKSAPPEAHSSHVAGWRRVGHLCHLGPSGHHWSERQHSSCPARTWRLPCPRHLSGHLLNVSAWEAGQVADGRLRLPVAGPAQGACRCVLCFSPSPLPGPASPCPCRLTVPTWTRRSCTVPTPRAALSPCGPPLSTGPHCQTRKLRPSGRGETRPRPPS